MQFSKPADRAHYSESTRGRELALRVAQVVVLVSVALAAIAVQRHFLRYRVAQMDPEVFAEQAIELKRTNAWIWGYYRSDHGAVLARAPLFELERDSEPFSPEGLTPWMRRDLRLLPWRIGGEVILYVAVAALLVVGGPWLARRAGRRRALAWGAAGVLAFALFALPHVATGYGAGLYSNLWGPMPGSYTTPPFGGRPTMLPADTISYRPLLEWALYPGIQLMVLLLSPLEGSDTVAAVFEISFVQHVFYWTVQLGLYFLAVYLPAKLVVFAR